MVMRFWKILLRSKEQDGTRQKINLAHACSSSFDPVVSSTNPPLVPRGVWLGWSLDFTIRNRELYHCAAPWAKHQKLIWYVSVGQMFFRLKGVAPSKIMTWITWNKGQQKIVILRRFLMKFFFRNFKIEI